MGRRIFEEKKFDLDGKILPFEQFRLFADKPQGFKINEEHYPAIIAKAERWLDKDIPVCYAGDYMIFSREGNRGRYDEKSLPRRDALLALATAEYVERKGRFTDKLIDVIWLLLEETMWVPPAHNPGREGAVNCLPYAYNDDLHYIDLLAGNTAANLAFVYYLCRDILDEVTTLICDRILYELDRRIIKPFLNDVFVWDKFWWTGVRGNTVNNWCPWVVSNILTVTALTVKDTSVRTVIVKKCLPMLDSFISGYSDDGGCDEGPSYWNVAGGALYNACCVLYDMTNGYINIYDDPLFRRMGEYAVKVVVTENRSLNFADSPGRFSPDAMLLYDWGRATGSEMMMSYGLNKLGGKLIDPKVHSVMCYRGYRFLTEERHQPVEFTAPEKFFLDGIVIAVTRENKMTDKGLYLAFKGGHNGESHNHNDVGTLIVFADGKPVFIDAGSGGYTRRTFSPERYTIWAMNSDFHNCATFNDTPQLAGKQYRSDNSVYDESSGKLTLDLKNAYPEKAGIESYHRSAVLENSVITVEDDVCLKEPGKVMFSYILVKEPENVTDTSFEIFGRMVTFDKSLKYSVEALDKTWPETKGLPRNWDTEQLYRVTLTSKEPVREKKYILTVR